MSKRRSLFWVVYRKELLDSLRDRRALISMIAVPLVVMPLLLLGMGGLTMKVAVRAETREYTVMILGEDAPEVIEKIAESENLRMVPAVDDFRQKIADRSVQAVLEIPDNFAERILRGENAEFRIFTYGGDSASGIAAERLENILRAEKARIVRERLAEKDLSEKILQPFSVVQTNVAPPEKVTGALLGGILPYVLIMVCITGAIYPALDLTAGEKERGTMETLLSSPVPRSTLVFGKFGVVLTFSLASGFLAVGALGGSFWLAVSQLETAGQLGQLALNPVSIAAFFLLLVPIAALFSALLLVFSLFARTFREAQTYVGPLMIAAILPAAVAVIPGVELTGFLAMVPVLNVSLIGRDLLSGIYPWGFIGLILFSSSLYAALALWLAVKLFQKEAVIFRE